MYHRNDGSNRINALQNQFTAYLTTAIRNARGQYIRNRTKQLQREQLIDDYSFLVIVQEVDKTTALEDADELFTALKSIKDRERYVFLARVLDERGFDDIAAELGMSYKGVAAIYYRTIAKLRKRLEE